MGRKLKQGLNYFPFDVSFFSDIKVRKLIKYQGGESITVYTCLLCNIYENGYYIQWDSELPFIISEITGYEEDYISEVIKSCLKIDLFSEKIYQEFGVLTSVGIQNRYEFICKQAKRKSEIKLFNLLISEDTPIYSEEINDNSEDTPINSGKSAQSKVKEIKENKSKVNEEEKFPPSTTKEILSSRKIVIEQWAMNYHVSVERIQECIIEFAEFKYRSKENLKWQNESDLIKNFEFWLNSNAKPKLKPNTQNGTTNREIYRNG